MRGVPTEAELWGKLQDAAHGGPAWHPLAECCPRKLYRGNRRGCLLARFGRSVHYD